MAAVMPSQKTVASARAVIDVTPWWAQWRTFRICCRSDRGMTAVLVKDDALNGVEMFLELVVHLEGLWELMSEFGEARLNERD